jgi:hypothetical protein
MRTRSISKFISFIILIGLLVGCALIGDIERMIEPGEKIGDFTIMKGKPGEFTWNWDVNCSRSGENNTYFYSCSAIVGETVSVASRNFSIYENSLEDIWEVSNYNMTINKRTVDLEAFGTIDLNFTSIDTFRFWNVVIITDKPGVITVKDSGVFNNGAPFSSSWTYTFIEP